MAKRNLDKDGLYQRQDSSYWWASYVNASGHRTRRSTGTANRKEAEALLAKWRLEIHRVKHWDEQPSRTFDELMLRYLAETQDRKRSARRDKHIAKHLYQVFTGRDMHTLSVSDIQQYISTRRQAGKADSTIRRELALLSSAIGHAIKWWDWQLHNPVAGRKPKQGEGRIRWISKAEATALLVAAESERNAPHLADFIRLALNTGMRKGELLSLEWRRVDLHAGLIHLEAEHTKSAKRRSVPLNQTARQVLISRASFKASNCPNTAWVFCNKEGKPILDVKRSFATACKRAGITDFRVHDLRHTCAAWLVSAGVALPEVRDLLGHSTIQMTEKYAHLAPENVRAAVAVLDRPESRISHASGDERTRNDDKVLI
ncbi:MAG: site-specific integrase [Candidatus Competibacteraceae bacterium]|nr:site-specific integrase [Candidatus Competibacteraceae bacterium]MCB1812288.1 site-specific integrase [Candidatus Competibacteraceae bacterium]